MVRPARPSSWRRLDKPFSSNHDRGVSLPGQGRHRAPLRGVTTGEDPQIRRVVCRPTDTGPQHLFHRESRVGMEIGG